jgi:hypothetical protein
MTAPLSNVALGREGSGLAQILDSSAVPSMFIDFYKQKQATAQQQEAARLKREQELQDRFMSIDYKPPEAKYANAGLALRNEKLKGVVDLAMKNGSWNNPEVMTTYTDAVGAVDRFATMAEEYKTVVAGMERAMNDPYKSKLLGEKTYDNYEKLTNFPPTAEGLAEALKFAKTNPMLVPKFNALDVIEPLIMERVTHQDGRVITKKIDEAKLEEKMNWFIKDNPEVITQGIAEKAWEDEEDFKRIVRLNQPSPEEYLKPPPAPRTDSTNVNVGFSSDGDTFTIGEYRASPVLNTDGTIRYVPFSRKSGTTEAKMFQGPDNEWEGIFTGYRDLGEGASPRYVAEFDVTREVMGAKKQMITEKTVETLPFDRDNTDANFKKLTVYLGADPIEATEMWAVGSKSLPKSSGKKPDSQLSESEWNKKWASLKPGQKMIGLDGNEYTKK